MSTGCRGRFPAIRMGIDIVDVFPKVFQDREGRAGGTMPAKAHGGRVLKSALRAVRLRVSAPFECRPMAPMLMRWSRRMAVGADRSFRTAERLFGLLNFQLG